MHKKKAKILIIGRSHIIKVMQLQASRHSYKRMLRKDINLLAITIQYTITYI